MNEKIDMSAKSPVPFDIRMILQKAGATVDPSSPNNFRLPWGAMYTCPRINDGDKLAKQSQIDKLKRVIQAGPPSGEQEPAPQDREVHETREVHEIKAKVLKQIRAHEDEQLRLIAEADSHEAKANVYKQLLKVIEDMPEAESLFLALMAPSEPEVVLPAPPPEKITEQSQITSRFVYLATQSFDRPFGLDELVEAMMAGKDVSEKERLRVRVCVANIMKRLTSTGQVVKTREGQRGKTGSALWARVKLPEVLQPVELASKRAGGGE